MKQYIDNIPVGKWGWNVDTDFLYWDDEMFKLLEVDPKTFNYSYSDFREIIHPDDIHRIESDLKILTEARTGTFTNAFKTKSKGNYKYILGLGQFITPEILGGINYEIDKNHYYSLVGSPINIEMLENTKMLRSFFGLRTKLTKPFRLKLQNNNCSCNGWVENNFISNSKMRIMNESYTDSLITEWQILNGSSNSEYCLNNIIITNLSAAQLTIWITGKHHKIPKSSTIMIPMGETFRIECYGVGHIMITWLDYYHKNTQDDFTEERLIDSLKRIGK